MKQDICKRLGKNIKSIRLEKGLSQGDICRAAKMDRGYVSSLENGKRNPTIMNVEKVADALGVPIDELLRDHGIAESSRRKHYFYH